MPFRLRTVSSDGSFPTASRCHSRLLPGPRSALGTGCTVGMTEIEEEAAKPPRDQTDISHGLNALGRFFDLQLFDLCYREIYAWQNSS